METTSSEKLYNISDQLARALFLSSEILYHIFRRRSVISRGVLSKNNLCDRSIYIRRNFRRINLYCASGNSPNYSANYFATEQAMLVYIQMLRCKQCICTHKHEKLDFHRCVFCLLRLPPQAPANTTVFWVTQPFGLRLRDFPNP